MYELTMFMVCNKVDKIRKNGRQTMQITMPMVAPRVYRIPGSVSFDVVFGILGVDTTKPNVLHTQLTDPKGHVVYESVGEMPPNRHAENVPEEYRAMVGYANIWEAQVSCEGIFLFTVMCNDEHVDTISIPIFLNWNNCTP